MLQGAQGSGSIRKVGDERETKKTGDALVRMCEPLVALDETQTEGAKLVEDTKGQA